MHPDPKGPSPSPLSHLRAVLILVGLTVAFVPLGLHVRSWAMERALSHGTTALSQLSSWLPESSQSSEDENEFFPFFRVQPPNSLAPPAASSPAESSPEAFRPGPSGASSGSPVARPPPLLPQPTSVVATEQRVLSWVDARLIPQGRARRAEYGLPSGIELSGVAPLGVGLLDGDRLVSVAGVPVQTRAQVIAQVLAARGRQEQAIVARLARRTALGIREFTVTVEQPYLPESSSQITPAEPLER